MFAEHVLRSALRSTTELLAPNENYNDTAATVTGHASTSNDDGAAVGSGSSRMDDDSFSRPAGNYLRCVRSNQAGSETCLSVPSSNDILMTDRNLMISGGIRVSSFAQGWQGIIAHGEGGDYGLVRRDQTNRLACTGGNGDTPDTGPEVNDNAWHHIVVITGKM